MNLLEINFIILIKKYKNNTGINKTNMFLAIFYKLTYLWQLIEEHV